ncbi:MAG: hypothetical protein QW590_01470 [Candidatus Bilamarchaeaceae archaeon]
MKRQISFEIYLIAFIIATAIFAVGIFVGKILDNTKITSISSQVNGLSQRLMTLQIISLMEENNSAFCSVYRSEFSFIENEREKLGYELTYLEEKKEVYDPETKRMYFLLEAQSYLLSKKLKDICADETVLLLYFYSNANCSRCGQQGAENLAAKEEAIKQNISVRIYSFDGDLGSPVVDAFKMQYNVKAYPTLVINGVSYPGEMKKEQILEAIKNAD